MRHPCRLAGLAASALIAVAAPAAVPSDQDFIEAAANGGMLEVELGKLAARDATDPEVRAFAERMADDHTKLNQELKSLAERLGLELPPAMGEKQRDTLAKLSKLRGPAFDKVYVETMVEEHEDAVAAFRAQADEKNGDLDRWASMTLAMLETHQEHAERLAKRIGG